MLAFVVRFELQSAQFFFIFRFEIKYQINFEFKIRSPQILIYNQNRPPERKMQKNQKVVTKRQQKQKGTIEKYVEDVPPFAKLCVDIILKMTKFPKESDLQKTSLVDQICNMINEFANKWQNQSDPQLNSNIQRLKGLFKYGVQRNKVFDQERIKDGLNTHKKIIFHPTYTITGQIMRQLVLQRFKNDTIISYGHHGIAKTFNYYLYHELSNLFIKQTFKCNPNVVDEYLNNHQIKIPKLLYWSMEIINLQSENSQSSQIKNNQYRKKVKNLFLQQCKDQITQKYENQSLTKMIQKICQFYRSKNVLVYLLVDQINLIASAFRQKELLKLAEEYQRNNIKSNKIIPVYQNPQKTLINQRYQYATQINKLRCEVIASANNFDLKIYNSSVNFEYLFILDNYNYMNSQFYTNIQGKLKLFREFQPNRNDKLIIQKRILYPQIIHFDSSIWSLTDTIIFQLRKVQILKLNEARKSRELIFNYLKRKNAYKVITFLKIRSVIQSLKESQKKWGKIQDLMDQFYTLFLKKQQHQLRIELNKFKNKICFKKIPSYYNIISIIYHRMLQVARKDEQQDLPVILPFLKHPTKYKKINTRPFYLLNRNFFIPFDSDLKLNDFLLKIEKFTIQNFQNWFEDKQKKLKIKEDIQKELKRIQKIKQQQFMVFCLDTNQTIIKMLDIELDQSLNLNQSQYKQFIQDLPVKDLGTQLEKYLKKYFEEQKGRNIKTNSGSLILNTSDIQQKTIQMKQLPRLTKNQKNAQKNNIQTKKKSAKGQQQNLDNQNNMNLLTLNPKQEQCYKQFIKQFFESRISGCYLYVPKRSSSKCVDFAILKVTKNKNISYHSVYLFQVTIMGSSGNIKSKKMDVFLEAYYFAVDYIIKQAQISQNIVFDFNFIFLGSPNNKESLKDVVQKVNRHEIYKKIMNRDSVRSLQKKNKFVLNQIDFIDFGTLGDFQKFPALNILKQVLSKKIDQPQQSQEEGQQ